MVSDTVASYFSSDALFMMTALLPTAAPEKLGRSPEDLRTMVPLPLLVTGPRMEAKTLPPLLQVIVPLPSHTTVNGPGVLLALRLWLTIQFPVPPKSNTQDEPPPNTGVQLELMMAAFAELFTKPWMVPLTPGRTAQAN